MVVASWMKKQRPSLCSVELCIKVLSPWGSETCACALLICSSWRHRFVTCSLRAWHLCIMRPLFFVVWACTLLSLGPGNPIRMKYCPSWAP